MTWLYLRVLNCKNNTSVTGVPRDASGISYPAQSAGTKIVLRLCYPADNGRLWKGVSNFRVIVDGRICVYFFNRTTWRLSILYGEKMRKRFYYFAAVSCYEKKPINPARTPLETFGLKVFRSRNINIDSISRNTPYSVTAVS